MNYVEQKIVEGRAACRNFVEFYAYLQRRKIALMIISAHDESEPQSKPRLVYYFEDGVYPEEHLSEICRYEYLMAHFLNGGASSGSQINQAKEWREETSRAS
jgi:hypothetical protein